VLLGGEPPTIAPPSAATAGSTWGARSHPRQARRGRAAVRRPHPCHL